MKCSTTSLLGESPQAPATHLTVAALSKLQASPLPMPDNEVEVEETIFTKGTFQTNLKSGDLPGIVVFS